MTQGQSDKPQSNTPRTVKRYWPILHDPKNGVAPYPMMEESIAGRWVTGEDYEQLERELAEAKDTIDGALCRVTADLSEAVGEICSAHIVALDKATPSASAEQLLTARNEGLQLALDWKPNTPQLENAMTYAWEQGIKQLIRGPWQADGIRSDKATPPEAASIKPSEESLRLARAIIELRKADGRELECDPDGWNDYLLAKEILRCSGTGERK